MLDHGALTGKENDDHPQYALDADLTAHAAAADPHAGYQKETEKGAVGGYASLDAGGTVPDAQLPLVVRVSRAITQVAHGFAVGNFVRYSGTAYVKAQADTGANAEVVGIVSAVADADNFTLQYGGRITGLSGLTAGTVYFLSAATAGLLTATEPTTFGQISKPLLLADSTTTGYFFNFRGVEVDALAIVNADVDAAAAIAYSKLNLATSIVNADIAAAAAIARSKLETVTRKGVPVMDEDANFGLLNWPDAVQSQVFLFFAIPDDYVSGDLTWKFFRRGGATNTAVMSLSQFRFRDATAYFAIEVGVAINFTPGNTNSQLSTRACAAANFVSGDIVRLDLTREGAHASDTMTAGVDFDGAWVEYLGRA